RARFEQQAATDPATTVDESDTPERQTSLEERRQMIYDALDGFSEVTREILLLKDIHGLRLEEVAKILSLPLGTVKSRSNRARIQLAKSLSERLVDESGTC
ncbi:MAG: sigma-70 family RNA polymerase sigma factor, partial [Gammaproteobacteria bacterium]